MTSVGKVIKIHGGFYEVLSNGELYLCRLRGKNKLSEFTIVTGDHVEIDVLSKEEKKGVIISLKMRKNLLQRPSIANIDQIIIVSAHNDPKPDFLLIDKFLIIARYLKVKSIICFNKEDLGCNFLISKYYLNADVDIISTSVLNNKNIDLLIEKLNNKISVLVGNSGVGKSSLINRILNKDVQDVRDIGHKIKRGRHTTKTSTFFRVNNGFVVDTPGFNVLDLFEEIDLKALLNGYPEYQRYRELCHFRNCTHTNEPNCEIKIKIDERFFSKERYNNYRILLENVYNRRR